MCRKQYITLVTCYMRKAKKNWIIHISFQIGIELKTFTCTAFLLWNSTNLLILKANSDSHSIYSIRAMCLISCHAYNACWVNCFGKLLLLKLLRCLWPALSGIEGFITCMILCNRIIRRKKAAENTLGK